jgi:hypothetical protein
LWVIRNIVDLGYKQCARILGRTYGSVLGQIWRSCENKRQPTKGREAYIRQLYNQGLIDREIATEIEQQFGDKCHITTIYYWRKRHNLPCNCKPGSEGAVVHLIDYTKREILRDLHAKGLSDRRKAKCMGVSASAVSGMRRRMGIPAFPRNHR